MELKMELLEEKRAKMELLEEIDRLAEKVRTCDICGSLSKEILLGCGACRKYRYCSKECQRAHWPEHKLECRILSRERLMHIGEIIMKKSRTIDEFLKFYTKNRMDSIIDAGCEATSLAYIMQVDCNSDKCNDSQAQRLGKKLSYLGEIAIKERRKMMKRDKKYARRRQKHLDLGFKKVCLEILYRPGTGEAFKTTLLVLSRSLPSDIVRYIVEEYI